MNNKKIKILHCLTGAAGQPYANSRAQRKLGYKADSVMINRSKLGYKADYYIDLSSDPYIDYSNFLSKVIDKYDVFHFYFRPFFFFNSNNYHFPTAIDLLLLRAKGKIVIFNYRGSEVRNAKAFSEFSPFHYVNENPNNIFTKFPDDVIEQMNTFYSSVCHEILVPDPELRSYVPNSKIIPRSIDLGKWKFTGLRSNTNPMIVHAPTRKTVKGSDYIINALNELKEEGYHFRFKLIEGVSNEEIREIFVDSDIVVDQLRIGWYGVTTVEAMALGKVAVAYIRDDLLKHLPKKLPFVNANPLNIKQILKDLIVNSNKRREISKLARKYCEKNHDSTETNKKLLKIYEKHVDKEKDIDAEKVLDFINLQRLEVVMNKPYLLKYGTNTDKKFLQGGFKYTYEFGKKFILNNTTLWEKSGNLLEISSANGFWSLILSERFIVTGEETSKGGVIAARENAIKSRKSVNFVLVNTYDRSKKYDYVFTRHWSILTKVPANSKDFADNVSLAIKRAKKMCVFVFYSKYPYMLKEGVYHHNPEITNQVLSAFGNVRTQYKANYIVAEVIPF